MRGWVRFSLVFVGLVASTSTAGAAVQVLKEVPFGKGVEVRQVVRDECQVGTKLSSFIEEYGKEVTLVDKLGGGRVLDMTITEVLAAGGGAFGGPKVIEVSGRLKQGKKSIATFRAKRFSGGGAFGMFKGTCAILDRVVQALGRDIAGWLENPEDGAELGDAR